MIGERIEIPSGGAYFYASNVKFHISIDGERIIIRCVETPDARGERLFTHQPAGNVIFLEAQ
ncbi:MAG: hypothetical protein GOVbin4685_28 [Prokaryotic dsDNA virus sp.]|jgi:hypothetical protein|nr:MAG: hypothetical protein GOVbin4685_28 [Prokaryotic dsDNA virus sp.]